MPVERPPFYLYQELLQSQYHGTALWNPNPVEGLYDCGQVSIGDVGYLFEGDFIRMFNVTLPWDDPSNTKLGMPDAYESLEQDPDNVRPSEFDQVEYYSCHVFGVENDDEVQAESSEE
jgi:hypothetical protein